MKYYLQFLFNLQVLLVVLTSCHVWFSYPLFLELKHSDPNYYINSYFFFFSCICFLCSLMIVFFSISNHFLWSLFSDNIILNFLTFIFCFTSIYFLTMKDSYSFIGILMVSTLSIMNVCSVAIVMIKKQKNINSEQFFFIKSRLKKEVINDEFVLEGRHKGILYAEEHIIYFGKFIKNNDVKMLEENFGKKIYELSEEEKMTVFMYAIS